MALKIPSWLSDAAGTVRGRVLRPLRRRTVIGPLIGAWQMRAVLRSIHGDIHDVRVLGPEEFAGYIRHLTPLSPVCEPPSTLAFDYIIVRQDHVSGLGSALLSTLRAAYTCILVNRRFVLFAPQKAVGVATLSPEISFIVQRIDTLASTVTAPSPRRVIDARQDRPFS